MSLCRYGNSMKSWWGWIDGDQVSPIPYEQVRDVFAAPGSDGLLSLKTCGNGCALSEVELLAPVLAEQEIWAAGVTYESSKFARMAESPEGGDFYAKVYIADRPELFLKASPGRTRGPGDDLRVRADSSWNVPEPELAVVIAGNGTILGYTIGNDMSSRDIEGANPLYLPQAKVYNGSCAVGPVIIPASGLDPHNLPITLSIVREGVEIYRGETSTAKMKRNVQELSEWLFRELDFPFGAILLTGTGLIPPDEFSLIPGDNVKISIGGIGDLANPITS